MKAQYKSDRDIAKYKQNKEKQFHIYLQQIYQITKNIQPSENTILTLIGKISAGKSALLNKLFGLNLEEGVGETTLEKQKTYELNNGEI